MLKYRSLKTLVVVSVSFLLIGCQPATTSYYRGASAVKMGAITITKNLGNEQVWQDLYLTVTYQLQRTGDRLTIKGRMGFTESSKTNYTSVSDMKLKLFLLDQDLLVVDSMDIARTLSYHLDDETGFNRTLQLESHVVALAFGYDGYLVDNDPEFPSVNPIWKIPKK